MFRAVAVMEGNPMLEYIGVVARFLTRRLRRGQVQETAQLLHEKLIVGALRAAGLRPAGNKRFYWRYRSRRHITSRLQY